MIAVAIVDGRAIEAAGPADRRDQLDPSADGQFFLLSFADRSHRGSNPTSEM